MELKNIETAADYTEYQNRFEQFMHSEGINCLSIIDVEYDPHFSHHKCDCCRRPLGGDRYDCNGYNPTTKEVQGPYEICTDCLYYAEYGQLDDMTMMDITD